MKTLYGKPVYESLAELVDPQRTAVLVAGMSGKTYGDSPGGPGNDDVPSVASMAPRLSRLVQDARGAGVFVVWIEESAEDGGFTDSAPWTYFKARRRAGGPVSKEALSTDSGSARPGLLTPSSGEPIVRHNRLNAFVNTSLDVILRNRGVRTAILTGVATEVTVESTARGATHQDYYSVVLTDCVASWDDALHQASLACMASYCECATSDLVRAAWGRP